MNHPCSSVVCLFAFISIFFPLMYQDELYQSYLESSKIFIPEFSNFLSIKKVVLI